MSEWIEWGGAGSPGIGDAEVELKFRDGLTTDGHTYPAHIIGWQWCGMPDDIVAYRIATPPTDTVGERG